MRGVEGTRIVSTQEVIKTTLAMINYISELHVIKTLSFLGCVSHLYSTDIFKYP